MIVGISYEGCMESSIRVFSTEEQANAYADSIYAWYTKATTMLGEQRATYDRATKEER